MLKPSVDCQPQGWEEPVTFKFRNIKIKKLKKRKTPKNKILEKEMIKKKMSEAAAGFRHEVTGIVCRQKPHCDTWIYFFWIVNDFVYSWRAISSRKHCKTVTIYKTKCIWSYGHPDLLQLYTFTCKVKETWNQTKTKLKGARLTSRTRTICLFSPKFNKGVN